MVKTAARTSLILAFASSALLAAPAHKTLTVFGQADRTVDRQNIQDAIDLAEPGDTVELVDTFLLDGERIFIRESSLTLTGRAEDDDGDGAVNEDWQDGVDNDGDGSVDEDDWDAALVGLANPDGTPVTDVDLEFYFNRAVSIEGITGAGRKIALRHLKFSTFDRAINLFPEYFFGTRLCADLVVTEGSLQQLTIEHNWFDNNIRDVVANGAVRGSKVADNLTTGALNISVLLLGEEFGCDLPDGTNNPIPMGRPRDNHFSNNRIGMDPGALAGILSLFTDRTKTQKNTVDHGLIGIYSSGDDRPQVLQNRVSGAGEIGIVVEESPGAKVSHNDVVGGFAGLYGALPSSGARFTDNAVTGAFVGAYFEFWANGFLAVNNAFVGSVEVDYFLDETTFGNKIVVTDPETSVLDLGTDNEVVGMN